MPVLGQGPVACGLRPGAARGVVADGGATDRVLEVLRDDPYGGQGKMWELMLEAKYGPLPSSDIPRIP